MARSREAAKNHRGQPDFVGRSQELAALRRLLDGTLRGRGGSALVSGEAGIGKTRLLSELLGAPQTESVAVHRAGGEELERDRPFGLIAGALGLNARSTDEERRRLGSLIAGETAGSTVWLANGPAAFRIAEEIVDLVERRATGGSLILALEDLHWADAETLSTLHRISRSLDSLPILLIGTMRPTPNPPALRSLVERLERGGAEHIALGALTPDEVDQLSEGILDASPGTSLARITGRAGGNPLFVTETLSSLGRDGSIVIQNGRAETTISTTPRLLSRTLLRRLVDVGEGTSELLRLASALGSAFSVNDLAIACGRPATDLAALLEEALRAGILDEAGDRLRFRHDLLRDAVYNAVPQSLRQAMHLQAARAFAAAGAPATKVAIQMSLGAERGDAEAIRWLREAARFPAASPAVSVGFLERALELADPQYREADALLAEHAVALIWAMRPNDAENRARELLGKTADPGLKAAVRLSLAAAQMLRARWSEAALNLEPLVTDQGSGDGAYITAMYAHALANSGSGQEAVRLAHQAIAAGEETESRAAVRLSHYTIALDSWQRGDVSGLTRSAGLFPNVTAEAETEFPWWTMTLAAILADADCIDESFEHLASLAKVDERSGTILAAYTRHCNLLHCHFHAGNWDDAVAEAEAGLAFAEENDIGWGWMILRPDLAVIAVHRGDLELAQSVLPTEADLADRGPNSLMPIVYWARALLEEAMGDSVAAAKEARRAEETMARHGPVMRYPPVALDSVRLALETGDREYARTCLERLERLARQVGTTTAKGAALRARGLMDGNAQLLLDAVTAYREGPRPAALAAACEDAGAALAPNQEGIQLIRESLEIFERLDAKRDVARVESRLRALGARRGARGRRARPSTGWESLTPTEGRITALVAEGLSNPEMAKRLFVSRYTIQTHLQHIFAKLGVSTRLELALASSARSRTDPLGSDQHSRSDGSH